jgi:hypothetical protein
MLTFFETRLRDHAAKGGTDEGFVLLPEDCRDLRHEAHLYYQRYLSLFVLEEYDRVTLDTGRNLRVIELCRRYAETEFDRTALESQWPYVMMMHTRAQVYAALDAEQFDRARTALQRGLRALNEWEADPERPAEDSAMRELEVLETLREELYERMPSDAVPRLQWELKNALALEDFERAAELRDRLSAVQ